mmetsp:Transcript_35709/g.114313  ORF Transcript_35709/g.114313 Transcript_35709/m.114313 type:complete len:242 (+) Transcript_35709:262-987(+)
MLLLLLGLPRPRPGSAGLRLGGGPPPALGRSRARHPLRAQAVLRFDCASRHIPPLQQLLAVVHKSRTRAALGRERMHRTAVRLPSGSRQCDVLDRNWTLRSNDGPRCACGSGGRRRRRLYRHELLTQLAAQSETEWDTGHRTLLGKGRHHKADPPVQDMRTEFTSELGLPQLHVLNALELLSRLDDALSLCGLGLKVLRWLPWLLQILQLRLRLQQQLWLWQHVWALRGEAQKMLLRHPGV